MARLHSFVPFPSLSQWWRPRASVSVSVSRLTYRTFHILDIPQRRREENNGDGEARARSKRKGRTWTAEQKAGQSLKLKAKPKPKVKAKPNTALALKIKVNAKPKAAPSWTAIDEQKLHSLVGKHKMRRDSKSLTVESRARHSAHCGEQNRKRWAGREREPSTTPHSAMQTEHYVEWRAEQLKQHRLSNRRWFMRKRLRASPMYLAMTPEERVQAEAELEDLIVRRTELFEAARERRGE